MQNKSVAKGSTAIAASLAFIITALTVITVYMFFAKSWWFPPAISDFGNRIDAQFHRTLIITGVVFVLAQLGLAWAVFRYRDRGVKVDFFEGNSTMEFVWTLATVVLFVGLGLY